MALLTGSTIRILVSTAKRDYNRYYRTQRSYSVDYMKNNCNEQSINIKCAESTR